MLNNVDVSILYLLNYYQVGGEAAKRGRSHLDMLRILLEREAERPFKDLHNNCKHFARNVWRLFVPDDNPADVQSCFPKIPTLGDDDLRQFVNLVEAKDRENVPWESRN